MQRKTTISLLKTVRKRFNSSESSLIVYQDEQDDFGSDFESTDEEGAQEEVDAAAEKMVREEEKKGRKVRINRNFNAFLTLRIGNPVTA